MAADCWDGRVSQWIPLKGCAWLAGAREAQATIAEVGPALRQKASDALTMDNLVEFATGALTGMMGPLQPLGVEAALAVGGWTLPQAIKALGMVERLAEDTVAKRKKLDAALANVPKEERERTLASFRGRVGDKGAVFAGHVAKLAEMAGKTTGDLQAAVKRTRDKLTAVRFGITGLEVGAVIAVCAVIAGALWVINSTLTNVFQDLMQRRCLAQVPASIKDDPEKVNAFLGKCMENLGKAKEAPWVIPAILGSVVAMGGMGIYAYERYVK